MSCTSRRPRSRTLPLSLKAIDAGAHVYVEKPLAMNYGDARRRVDRAERARKKLTIGYTYSSIRPW